MGLKQNTSILAQLPLRQFGGLPAGIRSMWDRTDLRNSTVGQGIETELAGIPAGHYPPSSWNMPYRAGQISNFTYVAATFTGSLVRGTPTDISGGTTITISSTTAIKGAGNMEGAVTPFTPLSPQSLAAAVWSTIASEYNVNGTMGNKLNLASSGGVDYNTLAEYVWDYVDRTLTGTPALTLPEFLALKD